MGCLIYQPPFLLHHHSTLNVYRKTINFSFDTDEFEKFNYKSPATALDADAQLSSLLTAGGKNLRLQILASEGGSVQKTPIRNNIVKNYSVTTNLIPKFTALLPAPNTSYNVTNIGYTIDRNLSSGTIEFFPTNGDGSGGFITLVGSELNAGTKPLTTPLTNQASPTFNEGVTYDVYFTGASATPDGTVFANYFSLTGTPANGDGLLGIQKFYLRYYYHLFVIKYCRKLNSK